MFEHCLLGGDLRSWQTAKLIADWAAGPQTTNFIFGNARETGWMSKLVLSAYLATDDPFYLNAAKIMLDGSFTLERGLAVLGTDTDGYPLYDRKGGRVRLVVQLQF